jgi:hypothetical protein
MGEKVVLALREVTASSVNDGDAAGDRRRIERNDAEMTACSRAGGR